MASTPRTPAPAPERAPPPVPTPPPPVETPPPPSPSSSQPGDEYHTPAPSLADGSPREEASFPSDGNGREGGAPPRSPQLSPMRLAAPRLLLPPPSPRTPTGQNGQEEQEGSAEAAAAGTAEPAREPLRLATKGLARSPSSSQRSLATTNSSPSPPPSPLIPAAPVVNSSISGNNNRSGQSTHKRAAETKLPLSSLPPAATAAIAVQHFNPVEEAVTSPLHLGQAQRLDHYHHQQQQEQHAAAAAENGGSVPRDVAAAVAVGQRRELSVTLRLATALLSLAAFSVIASARTTGWAGDYYAHHLQFRFGTDAFNRKITSALWLSFIAFLMLALNALISTANLFSML
ncbi:unnamed protein product [Miscanthus lutarioriparius]|uniref:CASP-like protein n=1 Tax=Miscanthus lutarioriparius TaxID=422564 RepID=A0A811NT42_9POAL|nr:unnamed protein product [Miscanthus lutarioriparius]